MRNHTHVVIIFFLSHATTKGSDTLCKTYKSVFSFSSTDLAYHMVNSASNVLLSRSLISANIISFPTKLWRINLTICLNFGLHLLAMLWLTHTYDDETLNLLHCILVYVIQWPMPCNSNCTFLKPFTVGEGPLSSCFSTAVRFQSDGVHLSFEGTSWYSNI